MRAFVPALSAQGLAFAATLALIACLFLATLTWPMGWDQGIFAWVGSVIRDGGLPYRDAVDVKGPLPYFAYAAVQVLLGHNTWGLRVLDALALTAGALALRAMMIRVVTRTAAAWAACALVLWIAALGFWGNAQPDGWVALLVTGSVVLAYRAARTRPGLATLAISGILVGLTALVKPFYIIFAGLPVATVLLFGDSANPTRERGKASAGALIVAAAVLPTLITAAWFAGHGALGTAFDVYVRYTAQGYAALDAGIEIIPRLRGLTFLMTRSWVLPLALPFALAGFLFCWRSDRRWALLFAGWALTALVFVALQGRFYPYQFLPAYPPLVAFATIGFTTLLERTRAVQSRAATSRAAHSLVLACLVLVLVHLASRPAWFTLRAARYALGFQPADDYYGGFESIQSYNARDEKHIARILAERSRPDERVAILGYNAGILFLANRRSATRFGGSVPFTSSSASAVERRFRDEFFTQLKAMPPAWIVAGAVDGGRVDLDARLAIWPPIDSMIRARYCIAERRGDFALFRDCGAHTSEGPAVLSRWSRR